MKFKKGDKIVYVNDIDLWSQYFKDKTKKHTEKYKHIIKEVIQDLKGNKPFNENYRIERK